MKILFPQLSSDLLSKRHFTPNVLYFYGTFETIANIETYDTFEDKLKQLEVTGLLKPVKGLAQFYQTMFCQMKFTK